MIAKDDILQYNWQAREEGYTALEHEIIFRDLCCGCGVCAAVCPEKVIEVQEFPKLTGKCTNCGYCLMQCPRSFFFSEEAESKIFGTLSQELLGRMETKLAARTKDASIKGQDGGFVTALLKYALEKKIIDGAIVSAFDKETWMPRAKLATSVKDLEGTSGTRYSNSPNLVALLDAKEKNLKALAVVGLPCQIEAVRKIQNYQIEEVNLANRIKLAIAIFCSSNFLYDGLMKKLVEGKYNVKIKDIKKIDIKGKNLLVYTDKGKTEIPLKEAYKEKREGCKVCTDFPGKLADVSVGAVDSQGGFSTVFARTKFGAELLNRIIKDGKFETAEIKELRVAEALQTKKAENAVKEIRARIMKELPLPFKSLKW
ncbi:MAG: Coenzyme F420 hydrogenase/dehydrogenase, beta subunit C-terminal domain [Euryarchaeota archaeon]|nr:Coenzyme F420 hydrogenase/dehydrogenase, beta subunit C-terminal domain [Euryarchaeota archaeon]